MRLKAELEVYRDNVKHYSSFMQQMSENGGVYEVNFYRPSGKWKYTDYLVIEKIDSLDPFTDALEAALKNTPESLRETSIRELSDWTVVMTQSPWGYPIMVRG